VHAETSEPVALQIPGSQTGGRKLAIVFTCDVCQTRSAKQFTERSYLHGVVIVRCPGCQNLHLIADRLGYFDDGDGSDWDLEKIAKLRGESIRTITDGDVFEALDLEDLVGRDKMLELQNQHQSKPPPSSK
jgi:mitochondrial protein import protein ZIM17